MNTPSDKLLTERHPKDLLHVLATTKLDTDNCILEYLKQTYITHLCDYLYPNIIDDLKSELDILFNERVE